jgi:hypothetical protein
MFDATVSNILRPSKVLHCNLQRRGIGIGKRGKRKLVQMFSLYYPLENTWRSEAIVAVEMTRRSLSVKTLGRRLPTLRKSSYRTSIIRTTLHSIIKRCRRVEILTFWSTGIQARSLEGNTIIVAGGI